MYKTIQLEIRDHIGVITLNRPDALNAINDDLKDELLSVMKQVSADEQVKVVLLQGAGRIFCAGGDIKGMGKRSLLESRQRLGDINLIVKQMNEMDKPIIAVVHGHAAGAGMSIALASDIIFAAEDAVFILSFSKIGLMPDAGSLYYLPRLLGIYKTKELMFFGGHLSAKEGSQLGFVNRTCPVEHLHEEAMTYACELAKGPSQAHALIKNIANRSLQLDLSTVLELERHGQTMLQQTADHKEGVKAFLEKRNPIFKGN